MQTTAYILSSDRAAVLLIHRNKCPDDVHFGKYLGIGGHVEPDEDVVTCIRREVAEETGLTISGDDARHRDLDRFRFEACQHHVFRVSGRFL
jgi:8-oxo-dGTP pyrophosphatase MutT (NUDIX family)